MSRQEFFEDLGITDRKEPKRQRRLRQWREQRRDRSLAKMAARITAPPPVDNEVTDDEIEFVNMLLADSEPFDETL